MFGYFRRARESREDAALNVELEQAYNSARSMLPQSDLMRLDKHLLELRDAGFADDAIRSMNSRDATHILKRAAIESIEGFITIEQRFPEA